MKTSARGLPAFFLALLFLGAAYGCSVEKEASLPPLKSAEITPERLWNRISLESPYKTFGAWPGHEGIQAGQAPHGPFHRIFINAPLREALPLASRRVPEGGIIVKENMNSGQEPTAITVMAKVPGFDPEHGDWYWARYGLDGKVQVSGSVRACYNCHAGMSDNDYVIVRRLEAPLEAPR